MSFLKIITTGVARLRESPQLILTMVVAVAIVGSFVYVADRFVRIANDAQEELANVRVGALQDAFAPLAAELFYDARLRTYMQDISTINPTIREFYVLTEHDDLWQVRTSMDERRDGIDILGQDFILRLAVTDPAHSFTVSEYVGGERLFRTVRAVTINGEVVGVVMTVQTLSEADKKIADSIQSGMIVLVLILLFLLLLFFRHARIIDYTVLYRKLESVDRLKDDFIAMASHELRTPITAIRGYAELLGEKDTAEGDRKTALERISTSAAALDDLIADMLDVSRIQEGRMKFAFEDIDPRTVIDEVQALLEQRAQAKGLVFELDVKGVGTVRLDRVRFRQVMVNLVGNAIKYTEKGSIKVTTYIENNQYVCRVSDTGSGMSAEAKELLFEKFYRVDSDAVRTQRGTGLGLWITKQIVEEMKGRVTVESIEGVGSHFIVRFPLQGT